MRSRVGRPSYGLAVLGVAAALFVGLALGLHAAGFRINLSVSHPLGVYCVVDREPAVGHYALFCVPVPLADLPPVDQTRVPPCTRDTSGYHVLKRIKLKRIKRIVPGGDIHVLGDHPLSLDSRIFGPLRREDIVSVALMVWKF